MSQLSITESTRTDLKDLNMVTHRRPAFTVGANTALAACNPVTKAVRIVPDTGAVMVTFDGQPASATNGLHVLATRPEVIQVAPNCVINVWGL